MSALPTGSVALEPRAEGTGMLAEIGQLFRSLDAERIRYCHWKSNEHLEASLRGESDLDMLVDRAAAQAVAQVLARGSFKAAGSPISRAYPGIQSYIGFDFASGRLVHLHLHYRLTLGERHLKSYRVPWEELLLSTRTSHDPSGVWTADPHLELLLLLLRAGLKLRYRDLLLTPARAQGLRGGALRELRWLQPRVDPGRLHILASELVGERSADIVQRHARPGECPAVGELRRIAALAQPHVSEYRTYRPLEALCLRCVRRSVQLLRPSGRRLPHGGVVVAMIGVDGSGKSTVVREIARWLSPFFEVLPIYFGSGAGPVSLPRRTLERIARWWRRGSGKRASPGESLRLGGRPSPLRAAGELMWVWALVRERRDRARSAREARDRGVIVLCDRFPTLGAASDGPRLNAWLDTTFAPLRRAARAEREGIQYAERLRPEVVVKLEVTAAMAAHRKPEMSTARVQARLQRLDAFQMPPGSRLVRVDATQPLEAVLLDVKRALWEAL